MASLRDQLYAVLAEQFSVELGEINDTLGPGDLPRWDSLGQLQLIMRLEKDFDIKFTTEDVISINNVGDLLKFLEGKGPASPVGTPPVAATSARTFGFHVPASIEFGSGGLTKLATLPFKKILVILGPQTASHLKEKIKSTLPPGAQADFFVRAETEPTLAGIGATAQAISKCKPDALIAAGGGSTLDTAKLACLLHCNPTLDLIKAASGNLDPAQVRHYPLIAIPTLLGSGAEVSSAALFAEKSGGKKNIVFGHQLLPDMVIYDAALSSSASSSATWAGTVDAFTHALEGSVSNFQNPAVAGMIPQALSILWKALDQRGNEELALGTSLAGIIQNHNSVGLVHSISHQLGFLGLAHGNANAWLLGPVARFNQSKNPGIYKNAALACGFDSEEDFIRALESLPQKGNLVLGAKQKDQLKSQMETIVEGASQDRTLRTNPVAAGKKEIEEICKHVFH